MTVTIALTHAEGESLGISLRYSKAMGRVVVQNVQPDGIGAKAGLQNGMQILTINGEPFNGDDKAAGEAIKSTLDLSFGVEMPVSELEQVEMQDLQPVAAIPAGGLAPPGAPPGGEYKNVKYTGCITVFCGLLTFGFACFCPCDEKEVYVCADGSQWKRSGGLWAPGREEDHRSPAHFELQRAAELEAAAARVAEEVESIRESTRRTESERRGTSERRTE